MLDLPTPPLPDATPMTVVRLPAWNGEGRSSPVMSPWRRRLRSSSVMASIVTWIVATPGSGASGLGHAPLDLRLERAAGHREADRDQHAAAADVHVAHHPEVDDAAVQLRVVHVAQDAQHLVAVRGRGAHMNILA